MDLPAFAESRLSYDASCFEALRMLLRSLKHMDCSCLGSLYQESCCFRSMLGAPDFWDLPSQFCTNPGTRYYRHPYTPTPTTRPNELQNTLTSALVSPYLGLTGARLRVLLIIDILHDSDSLCTKALRIRAV